MNTVRVLPTMVGPTEDYTGRWVSKLAPGVEVVIRPHLDAKRRPAGYDVEVREPAENPYNTTVDADVVRYYVVGWQLERVP